MKTTYIQTATDIKELQKQLRGLKGLSLLNQRPRKEEIKALEIRISELTK